MQVLNQESWTVFLLLTPVQNAQNNVDLKSAVRRAAQAFHFSMCRGGGGGGGGKGGAHFQAED